MIKAESSSRLPTRFGDFGLQIFTNEDGVEYIALAKGVLVDNCLVRLHSECATGDIFGSLRCDCRDQLELSLMKIADVGQGLLIYLRGHEGRGIGLTNKIKAYALQDQGYDTVDANLHLGFGIDERSYAAAVEILSYYGLKRVQLLTNNQSKISALENAGIAVTAALPLWATTNPHNEHYVETKRRRMGHLGVPKK